MATTVGTVIDRLRKAALRQDGGDLSDGQLLARFVHQREGDALAALVRRHGPLVWGVCRRALSHHDAEDAFQATFLVLVRKAASVRPPDMVANWLYGVARQTARKAHAMASRRRGREKQVATMPEPATIERDNGSQFVEEELAHLPAKYRVAIILCDLEGRTRKEAARQLNCPEGTLAGRLRRGRALLAGRLERRGVLLGGATLTVLLAENVASAAVPDAVVEATVKTLNGVAAGGEATDVSAAVARLCEGVLQDMLLGKLKVPVVLTVVLVAVACWTGLSRAVVPARATTIGVGALRPSRTSARAQPSVQDIAVETDQIEGLAISPDSQLLAGCGMDKKVRIWDLRTNELKLTLDDPKAMLRTIAFSPDGMALAAAGDDGAVTVWEMPGGKLRTVLPDERAFINGLQFLPGDRLAVAYNRDAKAQARKCQIKIWDIQAKTSETLYEQDGSAYSLARSPDGKYLAATLNGDEGKSFNGLKVWSLADRRMAWEQSAAEDFMTTVVFAPDSKTVAVGGGHAIELEFRGQKAYRTEGRLWLFDVVARKQLWMRPEEGNGTYRAIAFTADGAGVLTGSSGREKEAVFANGARGTKIVSELRRWNVTTGLVAWNVEGELGWFSSVVAAPDGKTFFGADGEQLMLFDPDNGFMRQSLMKWKHVGK